ncbi:MAG: PQQ-binding-like beta-propeller repeat protein, partial [Nitriliruptoraceae bacterium]|nr:PQQ-binding-like beta-propeller repeat protein [Nitriliruptoraceae bacterium]
MAFSAPACSGCSRALERRARFCPACGAPRAAAVPAAPDTSSWRRRSWRAGLAAGAAAVAVTGAGAFGVGPASDTVSALVPDALLGASDEVDLPDAVPPGSDGIGAAGDQRSPDDGAGTDAEQVLSRTSFDVGASPLGPGTGPTCGTAGCASWHLPVERGARVWLTQTDALLVAVDDRLAAIDAPSGTGRWQIAFPPTESRVMPNVASLDDEDVLIERGGSLQLRSLLDGAARWSVEPGVSDLLAAEVVDGVILATVGSGPDDEPAVIGLDRGDGSLRWSVAVGDIGSPVVRLDADAVGIRTSGTRIIGIDPRDGRTIWVRAGQVLFADNATVLVADDGRAERLRIDSGGSGASLSDDFADLRSDGIWTAINDVGGRFRVVDERFDVAIEADGTVRRIVGDERTATVVVQRLDADGERLELRRLDAQGERTPAVLLPGGTTRWGLQPVLGLADDGDALLLVSEDRRAVARIERWPDREDGATQGPDPEVRSFDGATTLLVSGVTLIEAGPERTLLEEPGRDVMIDGRVTGFGRTGGGQLLVRTTDGLLLLAAYDAAGRPAAPPRARPPRAAPPSAGITPAN